VAGESDLEVVADVSSAEDIVLAALDVRPDAAVIDVDLPGMDGLGVAARLGEKVPRSKEIADQLRLSVGTVRNHLSRIICKTGARNRVDAVRIARDGGWL
jgi:DNA-binding NarL/FixJ family response regulator